MSDDYIFTPQDVYEFVRDNNLESLKLALDQHNKNKCNSWYKCQGCSFLAVHHASYKRGDYLPLLLKAGVDIEARTDLLTTPLHIACGLNNSINAKLLIEAGANVESKDIYGKVNYLLFNNNDNNNNRSYTSCRCCI